MKSILLILLFVPILAFALTDFQCLNDCTQKGYMYQLCQSKCSTSGNSQPSTLFDAASRPMQQSNPTGTLMNSMNQGMQLQLQQQNLEQIRLQNELLKEQLRNSQNNDN